MPKVVIVVDVFVSKHGSWMCNERLLGKASVYADLRWPHGYRKRFEATEGRARRTGKDLWAEAKLDGMPEWNQRFEPAVEAREDLRNRA